MEDANAFRQEIAAAGLRHARPICRHDSAVALCVWTRRGEDWAGTIFGRRTARNRSDNVAAYASGEACQRTAPRDDMLVLAPHSITPRRT